MEYRRLGNSGLIVSALALGSMQFGKAFNIGSLDQKQTTDMIKFAVEHGINMIDTADMYSWGESETLIGEALKDLGIRDEIVLATKVRLPMSETNFNRSGAHRGNIMRGIESSLRRLQTDYIDLYQIHGWDSNTPLEETCRALDDLVHQGKVRYIGHSNYMAWQAALALGIQREQNLEKFVTAQMYYSLVGRDLEHDWIPFAQYTGMGILVWSPLAGGFLTGKYDRNSPLPPGTRFGDTGRFVPFEKEFGYRVIDALKTVAARHDVSPTRVAIAWTMRQPCITSVIIAARTLPHLEDNILATDLRLTDEDFRLLNEASDLGTPYPKWMVYQHDVVEDIRPRILHPELYKDGPPVADLRGRSL